MGIKGNDIADGEAKRYAGSTPTISTTEEVHTLVYARRTVRKTQDHERVNEWQKGGKSQALKSYHELGLEPTTRVKSMPEMALKREVLGWLIATRSGHGHFADYHERFGHEEEDIYCKCGQRRSMSHPFSCSSARALRFKLFSLTDRRPLTQKEVLGTAQGIKLIAEWAPKTELFTRSKRMRDGEEA